MNVICTKCFCTVDDRESHKCDPLVLKRNAERRTQAVLIPASVTNDLICDTLDKIMEETDYKVRDYTPVLLEKLTTERRYLHAERDELEAVHVDKMATLNVMNLMTAGFIENQFIKGVEEKLKKLQFDIATYDAAILKMTP